jgi:hypothetical protein
MAESITSTAEARTQPPGSALAINVPAPAIRRPTLDADTRDSVTCPRKRRPSRAVISTCPPTVSSADIGASNSNDRRPIDHASGVICTASDMLATFHQRGRSQQAVPAARV